MSSKKKLVTLVAAALLSTTSMSMAMPLDQVQTGFAKNVIVMIPDGMSQGGVTLTRWVHNNGQPLNMDSMASGLVKTHNSDTPIADSAPAGTAMATGHKTTDKYIGVKTKKAILPGSIQADTQDVYGPVANSVELAKLMGKATGIVATSEIMHATPADFSAHDKSRKSYDNLSEQEVFQNMDVVLGGGYKFFTPAERKDKQDLIKEIKDAGYNLVRTKSAMKSVNNGKIFGLFAPADMAYEVDRPAEEPSLADMTAKSIELLSKNKKGFFLMVEGSKVDWAAHANAPIGLMSDIKSFDDAVKVALDYAKSNKDTVVLVAADHGNSGITMGNWKTSGNYSELPLETFTSALKNAKASEDVVAKKIMAAPGSAASIIQADLGFVPTAAEVSKVTSLKKSDDVVVELGHMLADRANIGFTTNGHTGQDVTLYVYASDAKNQLTGTVQNSDIARYTAKAMGGDLDKATTELFVPSKEFAKYGVTSVKLDQRDPANVVGVVTTKKGTFLFPQNRNYFEVNGKRTSFNGIVYYSGSELYIPKAALAKIV